MTELILYKDDNELGAESLSLTFTYFYNANTGVDIGEGSYPPFVEIGDGWYKFDFTNDPEVQYIYQVDCGIVANITNCYAQPYLL